MSETISISSYGDQGVTIKGLTRAEVDLLVGLSIRQYWLRVNDQGRLEKVNTKSELPAPSEDRTMMPFWRRPNPSSDSVQLQLLDLSEKPTHSCPSFYIKHLCGYYYSDENYAREVEKLESWGFYCLRSRRDDVGRFDELWYLPGEFVAKGDLAEALKECNCDKTEAVRSFLCKNASFGTLDIVVQRAAMPVPD